MAGRPSASRGSALTRFRSAMSGTPRCTPRIMRAGRSGPVHPGRAAGVLRFCRRAGGGGPCARAQGLAGRVPGRHAVQGDLCVGAAPPGGSDAGRGRLQRQPGGSGARPVRHPGGALWQGDTVRAAAAASGGHRDAVGRRGGRRVPGGGADEVWPAGASGAVADRAGRADLGPAGGRAVRRLPGRGRAAGLPDAALPAAFVCLASDRGRGRSGVRAASGRALVGFDHRRIHIGRR